MKYRYLLALALAVLPLASCIKKKPQASADKEGAKLELLNVSYDPTRELYVDINKAFTKEWVGAHGGSLEIKQSHAGSGKQARAVADGLAADVVTLALAGDIDSLAKQSLLPGDWQSKLPQNSAPYTSTIVFVVRKGNPKAVKDWSDLIKPDVKVITPHPKTSGGARWNYLAAWAWAQKEYNNDESKVLDYMTRLFKNVPVLDPGARGATTSFIQREQGDVLLSWENEAYLIDKEFPGKTDIIYPSLSILAEPPVAVVEKNATAHGTSEVAKAYLEFLYTDEAQDIIGKNSYRPRNEKIAAKYAKQLPSIPMVTIDKDFGGWAAAQKKHFADGGTFDKIYQP